MAPPPSSKHPKRQDQTSPKFNTNSDTEIQAATPGSRVSSPAASQKLSILMLLFLLSLVIPVFFNLGSLRLSPNRLFVLVAVIPLIYSWFTGKAGKVRFADIMVILYGGWIVLAMSVVEGADRFQYAVITAIETVSPYLFARVFVRNALDYEAALKALRWIVIFLVPAAVYESLTTVMPYSVVLGKVAPTFPKALDYAFRLGLSRAQVVFEHPILFGVFVAALFSPVYALSKAAGRSSVSRIVFVSPVLVAIFHSLSSGAYLLLMVQTGLLAWGYLFRETPRRWVALSALIALGYVVIDLASNRTPFEVFTSYLTFDSSTAYARILIFQFGMENVLANPIFGLGFADWVRPVWFHSPSVDNFWLLTAMRYGVPAFALIALVLFSALVTMMSAHPVSLTVRTYRDAHIFSLIALSIAICTVHLWSATYVFMMFMIGAGVWVADADSDILAKDGTDPYLGRKVTSRRTNF